VCYQMDMTQHNHMYLHQNSINIAHATNVSNVCRYISLETNYTTYLCSYIVGKLSITHKTKISPAVLFCNFSLAHCIFYTLSTSYCLKPNQAFRANKTTTQSTVENSHAVKPINL
jgi:hypothetical protein